MNNNGATQTSASSEKETKKQGNEMEENPMTTTSSDMSGWTQLAESLYDFLNRRNTTIEYTFVDMEVMVPKSTGPDAPQANWKLNGSLRLRTWED